MNGTEIRQLERASIRRFVEKCSRTGVFTGRVLDYGCGAQPYRDLVAGEYLGYDRGAEPVVGDFDAVLCTQVLQYMKWPGDILRYFAQLLARRGGHLVLTYPTNWPEVEAEDRWRFTKAGMATMLAEAGFDIIDHEQRASVDLPGFGLALGYGALCKISPR